MPKLKPTLRQLRVFEAVADELSFTRASEKLHLSQPAVSIQVKQLEEGVGLPLFEHMSRRISLTEAGRIMYRCSQTIRSVLEDAGASPPEAGGRRHRQAHCQADADQAEDEHRKAACHER